MFTEPSPAQKQANANERKNNARSHWLQAVPHEYGRVSGVQGLDHGPDRSSRPGLPELLEGEDRRQHRFGCPSPERQPRESLRRRRHGCGRGQAATQAHGSRHPDPGPRPDQQGAG